MGRKSKAEKELDALIERACVKACMNIRINIFSLALVDAKAREIQAKGNDLATSVDALAQLRAYCETLRE